MSAESSCPLCATSGGETLWSDARLRVILIDEAAYPGLTRVVWQAHVAEMSDLSAADRDHLMQVVWQVEPVLRTHMRPDKVNLASLGNMVPHLHWHVVPRWRDDPTFPDAIWAPPRRAAPATDRADALAAYRQALRAVLSTGAAC